MLSKKCTLVTEFAPAPAKIAQAHFEALVSLETDCSDVHESMRAGSVDFVLLDVRGPTSFQAGHVDGAVHFPHADLTEANLGDYPPESVFVVYCAGPHCNGADKAAVRLSRLGRPVKKMLGGVEGWKDEGFGFVEG